MVAIGTKGCSREEGWFTDNWSGGLRLSVRVKRVLRDVESAYQHVRVLETEELGRMLVLDGNIQCAEADEAAYHELIVHPGLCRAGAGTGRKKNVLIIGGGDGGAAREALRHEDVGRVDLVDIDPEVTRAARELLPGIWRSPRGGALHEDTRLQIRNEDGLRFLEEAAEVPAEGYDLIVVDATDPVGPGTILFSDRFYEALRCRIGEHGAVSVQAGSWWFLPDVLRTAYRGLGRVFGMARAYHCWSAVYPGGLWNLVLATLGDDPAEVDRERAEGLLGCRFYDAESHRAAFVLSPDARRALRG